MSSIPSSVNENSNLLNESDNLNRDPAGQDVQTDQEGSTLSQDQDQDQDQEQPEVDFECKSIMIITPSFKNLS